MIFDKHNFRPQTALNLQNDSIFDPQKLQKWAPNRSKTNPQKNTDFSIKNDPKIVPKWSPQGLRRSLVAPYTPVSGPLPSKSLS